MNRIPEVGDFVSLRRVNLGLSHRMKIGGRCEVVSVELRDGADPLITLKCNGQDLKLDLVWLEEE